MIGGALHCPGRERRTALVLQRGAENDRMLLGPVAAERRHAVRQIEMLERRYDEHVDIARLDPVDACHVLENLLERLVIELDARRAELDIQHRMAEHALLYRRERAAHEPRFE